MTVLLVEDDDYKRTRLLEFMAQRFPSTKVSLAASLMSGVKQARVDRPRLVLLDMTLPNYDVTDGDASEKVHSFGGVEFLKQARRFKLDLKVVVITQFETFGHPPKAKDLSELDREIRAEFDDLYLGAVYYHASMDGWVGALDSLISPVLL